jgi:hypothetical protein
MGWQDGAVFVVVAGAIFFLVGRNLTFRRRRHKPVETFVPLTSLKKAPPRTEPEEPSCH